MTTSPRTPNEISLGDLISSDGLNFLSGKNSMHQVLRPAKRFKIRGYKFISGKVLVPVWRDIVRVGVQNVF